MEPQAAGLDAMNLPRNPSLSSPGQKVAGDCNRNVNLTPRGSLVHPLLGGEGRGEGERTSHSSLIELKRRGTARAFTLLEILVALSLLSIVVIAVYSSWNAILKSTRVGLDAAASSQRARMTMSTLQDSLLSACMFRENGRYYAFIADSEGEFSSLSFVARLPRSFLRSGKFGDLAMRRVSFSVENGPDSKKRLVLRQNPLLLEPDKNELENPLVLAKDVVKFKLEYWDPKAGENESWVTEWTKTNDLPKMVMITLGLGHLDQFSSQPQEELFTVIQLPAQAVRVEWQMPQTGPGKP
jgi:general secretion pathway protein J